MLSAMYSANFSLEEPSNINSKCRGQHGFSFSPSMAGNFISDCVMLGTLAGDAGHCNSEQTRAKVSQGTELTFVR